MPNTLTHSYFAVDVFDKLDEQSKKRLNNNTSVLRMFAQGPDPLYFYNLMFPFIGKDIRLIYPRTVHDIKTRNFFISLIDKIKSNNLQYDYQIMSMLYGFISHYVLDSIIHPYIIYKTGIYDKDIPGSKKYRSLHLDMELYLDGYMIFQRERMPIQNFKMYEFCFTNELINSNTKKILDSVIKDVYNLDNYSKYYFKSIKHMKIINRLFRYDKYGIKKTFYKLLDVILPKKQLKKEQLSYYIDYKKKLHYLNIEKNEWCHPVDQYETYRYSFVELYHIALNNAIKIINDVNSVLYDNVDIKILNESFENLSYRTGKKCDDDRVLKFFEY